MTVAFSTYAFPSTPTATARTLPDRLSDVLNVKEFGAKGDGVTDDTDAINRTIDYVYNRGGALAAVIFFPPGIYIIGKGGTTQLTLDRKNAAGFASLIYQGCGRDVSILRGNYVTASQPYGSGISVTNVTSGTGGVVRVTMASSVNLLAVNQFVQINGVTGVAAANGLNQISALNVGSNWIELLGTVFAGAYTGGGIVYAAINGGLPTNGILVVCNFYQEQVLRIQDLGIENLSTAATSGAFMAQAGPIQAINCRFKGILAYYNQASGFGGRISDCVFECSKSITSANSSSLSPNYQSSNFGNGLGGVQNGSVGCYFEQGQIAGCLATGFDVGFALSTIGVRVIACKASRCSIGFGDFVGGSPDASGTGNPFDNPPSATPAGPATGFSLAESAMKANWADRCTQARYGATAKAALIANVTTGNTGPNDPSSISSITFSAGTATVVTSTTHNLPAGTSNLVLITNPIGWTPDHSGNQIVSVTNTSASQFTYTTSSDPGSFTSATWNYALIDSMFFVDAAHTTLLANALTTRSVQSFNLQDGGGANAAISGQNFAAAMKGASGWNIVSPNSFKLGGWKFVQCGTVANNPRSPVFAELPPFLSGSIAEGQWLYSPVENDQFFITDGQSSQSAFAQIVSTGSSGTHYKVRYDGTNWRRIG